MLRPGLLLAFCFSLVSLFSQGTGRSWVVSKDGSGDFTTVQAALDAVPSGNTVPVKILIRKGVYYERLFLDTRKNGVSLVGEDAANTILTYNNHAGKVLPNGDTVNTWTSASFFIYGDDFSAENLTFQNDAGFTAGQAVALFVHGNRVAFRNCRMVGFQDVLFCSGIGSKQYYENCYIEGTTDFIFGPSTAVFVQCHIHSKKKSHVTAASTPREIPFGFVFFDCKLTADPNLKDISLGRPWQPNASVAYINCWMGPHIAAYGWHNWNNPNNEKTARYAEYQSAGPGANPAARVPWSRQLTEAEREKYTLDHILGPWKPFAGQ